MRRVIILFALALTATLLVGCVFTVLFAPDGLLSPQRRCARQVAAWRDEAQPHIEEWLDVVTLADNTSRMNLSPLIRDMQTIRRAVQDVEAPRCAVVAVSHLDTSMDSAIRAYTAFMAQESSTVVSAAMKESTKELALFQREIKELGDVPPAPLWQTSVTIMDALLALLPKSPYPRDTYINGYDPTSGERLASVQIVGNDGAPVASLEHGDAITVTKIEGPNCYVTTEAGVKGIVACAYTQLPVE